MSSEYDRCPNCMNPYDGNGEPCSYCGQDVMGYSAPACCLPPFTILQGKYLLGRVLGQGGFGITYIGYDMNLATYVAIKEYYPESISTRGQEDNPLAVSPQYGKEENYKKNMNRFMEEARNLSKFYGLPGIVSVRNFFFENGTAYIVMDYVEGDNLKNYLVGQGGRLDEATVLALMKPVFESLYEIHKQGLIHRDISPDNIMFDDKGGITLIDFGSVRGQSDGSDKTYTVMLKHGYAPQEQYYAKGNQGPWTDIYSLCATMYKMLTGNVPPNCIERMSQDSYIPASQCEVNVSPNTDKVINKGLAVSISDRYQNIGEVLKDLYGQQDMMAEREPQEEVSQQESIIKRSKLPIILGTSVAALVLVVVCLKVFVLGNGDDNTAKNTAQATETATDASAEDTTQSIDHETTETTTQAANEPVLPGEWTDFKFMIDDDSYQLPMTYEEWSARGWIAKTTFELSSGEVKGVIFHNNNMEITASLANYGSEKAGFEDCHVIGIQFAQDYYGVAAGKEIRLPGDITVGLDDTLNSSSLEQAMERYGTPTKVDNGIYCEYMLDDTSCLSLQADSEDAIYYVMYINMETPEGAQVISDSTVEQVPLNLDYEKPSATTDRFDDIISIEGINYKLFAPAEEFVNNGWTIECEQENLKSGEVAEAVMRKGDASFEVELSNCTIFNLTVEQCSVSKISATEDGMAGSSIIFPGGVTFGIEKEKIDTLYSDMELYYGYEVLDMYRQGVSNYIYNGYIEIVMLSEPLQTENGENLYYLSEISYARGRSTLYSNPSNTDYITGKMVEN